MSNLFCGIELGRRIERAEAALIGAAVVAASRRGADGFALPLAGGVAAYAGPGAPFNKVVGLGFAGVPTEAGIGAVERAYADHGSPTPIELSTLADPRIAELLGARGYRVVAFEDVLGCALGATPEPVPEGIEVRPASEHELDAWVDVVVEGFAHPDGEGVPSPEEFPRDVIDRAERDFAEAGVTPYVAVVDGHIAGGGSMRVTDGVAQLTGAATAPDHRRRGVQAALLTARLRDAVDAGADIAVVTTAPGSLSQRNVQRRGFHLLYTRAVFVKGDQ
ncbi:GNAT family N-acetyltransferase [Mycobacterium sp. ITM-2016-00316]|uniref:GNAT family N-acetyltransferase n=1 Tax=Mycobacterium sp. ITM-2016-00316 TaxID=2099695 RepID=UPI000CF8D38C|nr:GNAT family N-acetyltransferase [Mycobacterium sp. ITM-2016-00316]WNG82820.1 GNAT family N-acetyltransferase [Mycobacterium sp. ITM-2016-00316]